MVYMVDKHMVYMGSGLIWFWVQGSYGFGFRVYSDLGPGCIWFIWWIAADMIYVVDRFKWFIRLIAAPPAIPAPPPPSRRPGCESGPHMAVHLSRHKWPGVSGFGFPLLSGEGTARTVLGPFT